MHQVLPPVSSVKVAQVNGQWRLGFTSKVANDGPGYLKITGNGPGSAPMVAAQEIEMSDGTSTTVPGIGEMHYVIGGGHEHWHLLDFERYELRAAADPATTIVKDVKTGFCLADDFTTDLCGRNHPELTTVSEGIGVDGNDTYLGYLEGQYLTLDEATVPSGDYLLVNRVNPTGALLDGDPTNDAVSIRLEVTWSAGTPTITVTNSCSASIDCPAPPDPLPDPDPDPEPQPQPQPGPEPELQSPAIQAITPTPEPVTVPIVAPSNFAPETAKASMSRDMAGRLVRRAILKSTKHAPLRLRTTCKRTGSATFRCTSNWFGSDSTSWGGHVRVWYRLKEAELSWFYDLSATRRPGGKHVVTRAARGSASRTVFSGPAGSLFCARR